MTGQAERPLLFLDVDGPLLPFGEDPQHTRRHATPDSRLSRLSPRLGLRLAALPCELVWATTWEDDANAEVAPRLGLPTLPVVNWPESSGHEREDIWLGLCWKTRTWWTGPTDVPSCGSTTSSVCVRRVRHAPLRAGVGLRAALYPMADLVPRTKSATLHAENPRFR